MGTSGLTSGEWKRSAGQDIQAPATERAGLSYGRPTRHRATPRLYKMGSAGDSPAPVGDPPTGMVEVAARKRVSQ
jgi:hypothetical protein